MEDLVINVVLCIVGVTLLGAVVFLVRLLLRTRRAMRDVASLDSQTTTPAIFDKHKLIAEYFKALLPSATILVAAVAGAVGVLSFVAERARDEQSARDATTARGKAELAAAEHTKSLRDTELRVAKYQEESLAIARGELTAKRDLARESLAQSLSVHIDDHYRRLVQEATAVADAMRACHEALDSAVIPLIAFEAKKANNIIDNTYPFPLHPSTIETALSVARDRVSNSVVALTIGIRRLMAVLPSDAPSRTRLKNVENGIRECGRLAVACSVLGEMRADDTELNKILTELGDDIPKGPPILFPPSKSAPEYNKDTEKEYGVDITNSDGHKDTRTRLQRRRDALRTLHSCVWSLIGSAVAGSH